MNQTDISLVDKVSEVQALILILFSNGYHESQIGVDKAVAGRHITFLGAVCEFHFLVH